MSFFKVLLLQLAIFGPTLAASNCPNFHFWNGKACAPCGVCPLGFGLKTKCTKKNDTECQPCWPGFDYSNTTGMEPCIGCYLNSNCFQGNHQVIKNCTIFSPTVCQGCAEGSYFNPYEGENGGCIQCSPRCRLDETETRSCRTEHDRVCSKRLTTEGLVPTTFEVTSVPTSTDDSAPTQSEPTPTENTTGNQDEPLHEKSWLWFLVPIGIAFTALPIVITVVICERQAGRNRRDRNVRPPNVHGEVDQMIDQQRSPLIPRGLDQPIQTITLAQRRQWAQYLNGRDSFGHFYWQRVADRVGLGRESHAFIGMQNPTEAFITTYAEKQGSTVRSLVDALKEEGLTHFAHEIETEFTATEDQEAIAQEAESETIV